MSMRDAYRLKFEAQLDELNARLALARAKAKQLAADGKISAYEELADTERKLDAMKARLKTLGATSESAWGDLKGGVETAWTDLSQAAKRAFDRFG
ncbi:MAG: hypothetical protein JNK23_01220 [Opitutaceae bacterium]|nr:hypothetical protein [Opitutaceae bacterium]